MKILMTKNLYNMKKIIRLTESDLTRIVKRVINEQSEIKIFDPKQVINIP